jgi:asparagine N-glycosylation enzyme membrane subunit Stt3
VTAVALLPICAWLARLVASAESAPFADITLLRLGGPARRQLIWWFSTMLVGAAFMVVAILWARIANPHRYTARTLVLLVLLHLVQAACGTGLGALLARPYPVATGAAVLVVTGVMVASLVIVQVPPVGPVVKAFAGDGSTNAKQVAAMLEATGVAAALLLACCFFSRRAATR